MPARQNWFDGWRLFALLSLTLLGLSIWIAGMRGFEVDGVRMVIRFTARTSLVLFCLAFAGAALARLWPNAWTRWQRRHADFPLLRLQPRGVRREVRVAGRISPPSS